MFDFFIGTIKGGKLSFNDPEHFQNWVRSKKNGQYVIRKPTSLSDARSINQNALLWKRHEILSLATGYTKDELHEYCMYKCGFVKESMVFGEQFLIRDSSTKLTKREFSDLFKKQDEICEQLNDGLEIPVVLVGGNK